MLIVFRTLRNNWKKTVFFSTVSFFATGYAEKRYKNFWMMREVCAEAKLYGRKPLPMGSRNKHVTLLLNPVSNHKKGLKSFEKFGEPLIHLAGFLVNKVKTEKVTEARQLVELIEKTNIIAVAGGDGSVMEVVTGLLRREDADEAIRRYPIAILPAGVHNTFAKRLFNGESKTEGELVAEAAISIARHNIQPQDVVKVERIPDVKPEKEQESISLVPLESEGEADWLTVETDQIELEQSKPEEPEVKPYYSVDGFKVGKFFDAELKANNMPGFLYEKFRTFWSLYYTYNYNQEPSIKAEIRYRTYCPGCKKCEVIPVSKSNGQSLLQRILGAFRPVVHAQSKEKQRATTENPNCGTWDSFCVDTSELNIVTQGDGKLEIQIGKKFSAWEFIKEGWSRRYEKTYNYQSTVTCGEVEIFPIQCPETCYIDHDDFPLKPIRMNVLPKKVYFFASAKP